MPSAPTKFGCPSGRVREQLVRQVFGMGWFPLTGAKDVKRKRKASTLDVLRKQHKAPELMAGMGAV